MQFETYFKNHFEKRCISTTKQGKLLKKALFYSLIGPASRFRPRLCIEITKLLGQNPRKILPWASAIETLHTASLIFDDLPSMDNSKTRRGKKTSHLVFGEDVALLAGSCLFVEGFLFLKNPIFHKKQEKLLELLVSSSGFLGLMQGQMMDLKKDKKKASVLKMMDLKTGTLIKASVMGPCILWAKKHKKNLEEFSIHLGRAYQLSDDLKDKEPSSFDLKKELETQTKKALKSLEVFKSKADPLRKLCLYNQKRALN